jgi:hypothetical protein
MWKLTVNHEVVYIIDLLRESGYQPAYMIIGFWFGTPFPKLMTSSRVVGYPIKHALIKQL